MARQSAAKPCVKKKLAGQKIVSQIPWQELGMRSLSPFSHLLRLSPGWEAATWLMAREGELGGKYWHTRAFPLSHVQGKGVQGDWPPAAAAQGSDCRDCGQELFAACVVLAGGNK